MAAAVELGGGVLQQDQHEPNNSNKPENAPEQQLTTNGDKATNNEPLERFDVEHLATFVLVTSPSSSSPAHDVDVDDTGKRQHDDDGCKSANGKQTIKTMPADASDNHNPSDEQQQQQQQVSTRVGSRQQHARRLAGSDLKASSAEDALETLFALEKLSGIWTQQMKLELTSEAEDNVADNSATSDRSDTFSDGGNTIRAQRHLVVIDCETGAQLETFNANQVQQVQAFKQYNDIYNNILLFIIDNNNKKIEDSKSEQLPEIHIFQCVSNEAEQISQTIEAWTNIERDSASRSSQEQAMKSPQARDIAKDLAINNKSSNQQAAKSSQDKANASGGASSDGKPMLTVVASKQGEARAADAVPLVNVNVKETVQVFNQIAARREKSSPVAGQHNQQQQQQSTPASANNNQGAKKQQATQDLAARPHNKHQQHASLSPTNGSGDRPPADCNFSSDAEMNLGLFKQRSIRASLTPIESRKTKQQPVLQSSQNNNNNKANTNRHSTHSADSSLATGSSSTSGSSSEQITNNNNNQHLGNKESSPSAVSQSRSAKTRSGQITTRNGDNNNDDDEIDDGSCQGGKSAAARATGNNSNKTRSSHHNQLHLQSSGHQKQQQQHRSQPTSPSAASSSSPDQVTTNESYVSVLNHCFDDIEKFILRLQQAVTAHRELQVKRKLSRRAAAAAAAASQSNQSSSSSSRQHGSSMASSSAPTLPMNSATTNHSQQNMISGSGQVPLITNVELAMLSAKARGPSEEDYFEILSKFKLAFNLLAKLKGCIHDPNAPELVHFLFTPLTIIIESARNASPPIDPTLVGIPYLNQDALDLLSNCCTSKESDMWISLGPNWTQTIDIDLLKVSRLPSSFQPVFSDGWAPVIGELELIGLVLPPGVVAGAPLPSNSSSSSATSGHGGSNQQQRQRKSMSSSRHQLDNVNDDLVQNGQRGDIKPPKLSNGHSRSHHHLNGGQKPSKHELARRKLNGSSSQIYDHQRPDFDNQDEYGGQAMLDPSLDRGPVNYRNNGHHRNGSGMDELAHVVSKANSKSSRSSRSQKQQATDVLPHVDRLPFDDAHRDMVEPSELLERDYMAPNITGGATGRDRSHNRASSYHHQASLYPDSGDYGPPEHPIEPQLMSRYAYDPGYRSSVGSNAHPLDRHHAPRQSGDVLLSPAYLIRRYTQTGATQDPMSDHQVTRSSHARSGHAQAIHSDLYPSDDVVGGGYLDEADQEAMLLDLGPAQTEWFFELQSRGAMIVRVLFTREANNDKELTVRRGELLEILDNSRRWWRARNIDLEVAFVPHTIVAPMQTYQSLDELLISNCDLEGTPMAGMLPGQQLIPPPGQSNNSRQLNGPNAGVRYARQDQHLQGRIHQQPLPSSISARQQGLHHHQQQQPQLVRNSVTGPFRYF